MEPKPKMKKIKKNEWIKYKQPNLANIQMQPMNRITMHDYCLFHGQTMTITHSIFVRCSLFAVWVLFVSSTINCILCSVYSCPCALFVQFPSTYSLFFSLDSLYRQTFIGYFCCDAMLLFFDVFFSILLFSMNELDFLNPVLRVQFMSVYCLVGLPKIIIIHNSQSNDIQIWKYMCFGHVKAFQNKLK